MQNISFFQDAAIGKPLNDTERRFYETAAQNLPRPLHEFIPQYRGVVFIHDGKIRRTDKEGAQKEKKKDACYLVLEDITFKFSRPSILDLKMGTRQYSDTMNSDKIARKKQRTLDTTSHTMGLRLAAVKVKYIQLLVIIYLFFPMRSRRAL